MESDEGARGFRQAKQFFDFGQFDRTLSLLHDLDRAYPNTQNVRLLMALCFERLDRDGEAVQICGQLARDFQDPRAMEMLQRLQHPVGGAFEDEIAVEPTWSTAPELYPAGITPPIPTYVPVKQEQPWKRHALIGLGVAVLVVLAVIPPLLYDGPPGSASYTPGPLRAIQTFGLGNYFILLACSLVGFLAGGHISLRMLNALPHDTLAANLVSLGATFVILTLLGLVPLLGVFLGVVVVSRQYDLGCGGLIIFYLICCITTLLTAIVPLVMMVSALPPGALP